MDLHEYQAKDLCAAYGLPVLSGRLCHTPGDADAAADSLNGEVFAVKAQIHAGGRGKAGGVKLARSKNEVRPLAEDLLGKTLVTPQTGPQGKRVNRIYVEEGCAIASEYYLSLLVDRAHGCIAVVASSAGGMEIEEVAHETPEKISKTQIDPAVGLLDFQCRGVAQALGLERATHDSFAALLRRLYQLFLENDLALLEINPLVLTEDGELVILDAKISIDDNALFRQSGLRSVLDYDELDSKDLAAMKAGLSFVALDGTIGCMVNGAGLAMATMDIIKSYGAAPANFLDVGGGASQEMVTKAFQILLGDGQVKGILVNIFGGIVKCDVIARGILGAAEEVHVQVPIVVRLQGTNVEEGRKLLADSSLGIKSAETLDEAAQKVVAAVGQSK